MKYTIILFFILNFCNLQAQIAINQDNSDPDASAILDVKSTDKGLLIPRMTTAQRTTISNPATGLMVFDNTTNSFWFYSGTAWTELTTGSNAATVLQDADNDTKIQVEESPDEDSIRMDIAGIERLVIRQNTAGVTLVNFPNNKFNTFLGQDAGKATTPGAGGIDPTGTQNTFIGHQTGHSNSTGHGNSFNGFQAGHRNTSGSQNLFSGGGAGHLNTEGEKNVFTGYQAGFFNRTGNENVYDGFQAGVSNVTGTANVFTGYRAGHNNTAGNGNVFMGYQAGYTEMGSNKLYIENSNSATPLIYGEFDNDLVKIHGILGIKDEYTFPTVKGTVGQVLQTDGAGNTTWATPAASSIQTLIADTNNDTKIQVEESADENLIRLDIAGTEISQFKKNASGDMILRPATSNIFIGQDVGENNTGADNIFIGKETGQDHTSGMKNTIIGHQAGVDLVDGNNNVLIGAAAGFSMINSSSNTAIGTGAGSGSMGSGNTYIGHIAGSNNINGGSNVAIGAGAGFQSSGSNNVFIGRFAGSNESGNDKLYIHNLGTPTPLIYGDFAATELKINGTLEITNVTTPNAGIKFPNALDPDATYAGTTGNFIAFGHAGSSEDVLSYKDNAFYFHDSPDGTEANQPSVYADAFTTYSSRRWKHNIQDIENPLSIIQQLQGVTYTWNKDHGNFEDFGFIAEEVHQVLPQIAPKGKDGQVNGVEYGKITPYLVEAIKEQQATIEAQQQEIQELKQQVEKVNQLESQLKQIQAQLAHSPRG